MGSGRESSKNTGKNSQKGEQSSQSSLFKINKTPEIHLRLGKLGAGTFLLIFVVGHKLNLN